MISDARLHDPIDWVGRAKALAPQIEAAAPRIDAECTLPPELVDALHEAGMYRLLLPRSCDGAEVDLITYAETMETLAGIDASTAWCIGQITGCVMSAAYVSAEVADEIFRPRDGLLAWGPPASGLAPTIRADVVDGGYRVTGTWEFASGSRQAKWLGAMVPVFERDGTQRKIATGAPEIRTVLFPKASATITDIWQVVGLRGTGSDRYAIADLFIPDEQTFTRYLAGWREPGPLFRFSMIYLHAVAFGAVALGIARATLDDFVELARHKRPTRGSFGQPLRENNAVQAHIGLAEARLRAAKAYLHASARLGWSEAVQITEGEIGLEARIDMRAASTYAISSAEEVVNIAYRLAGATAIFDQRPFERRFRDMHTVTQQAQGHLSNYETVGQHRLAVPMDLMI